LPIVLLLVADVNADVSVFDVVCPTAVVLTINLLWLPASP
jgi:hypothetical protein